MYHYSFQWIVTPEEHLALTIKFYDCNSSNLVFNTENQKTDVKVLVFYFVALMWLQRVFFNLLTTILFRCFECVMFFLHIIQFTAALLFNGTDLFKQWITLKLKIKQINCFKKVQLIREPYVLTRPKTEVTIFGLHGHQ